MKNYVSILLTKLGMQRRTQAAVYGAQLRNGNHGNGNQGAGGGGSFGR